MGRAISCATEAFALVETGELLKDAGQGLTNESSVPCEHTSPDSTRSDSVLRHGRDRPMAALGAKRGSVAPAEVPTKRCHCAGHLGTPSVILSNREQVSFIDRETDAHPCRTARCYSQLAFVGGSRLGPRAFPAHRHGRGSRWRRNQRGYGLQRNASLYGSASGSQGRSEIRTCCAHIEVHACAHPM